MPANEEKKINKLLININGKSRKKANKTAFIIYPERNFWANLIISSGVS